MIDSPRQAVLQSSLVSDQTPILLIRGGGDLASGIALRLHRVGFKILITECPQPLAVRRLVSFAEAVYRGQFAVEGVTARLAQSFDDITAALRLEHIPVRIDPDCEILHSPQFSHHFTLLALIDARMTKRPPDLSREAAPFVVGLGPGFVAGVNCHAAVETNRGHFLGRVIWQGAPQADTGIPEAVAQHQAERVLRAPQDGIFSACFEIGQSVQAGQIIAEVSGAPIYAPFAGLLRGLLHDGLTVRRGLKVGDLDPRSDPRYATTVSEKSLAIGGGVLEALLTCSEIRRKLWI